ncbi:unnamed protein product [Mytilus coruscus]|uniref:B box-type domain-containing protein n=1 Tax=Mytilus coruscus TaxID=42192 RepID=A0A6J8ANK6_MYTCO|nr:unnamed protein product [Mytilus coruscus]
MNENLNLRCPGDKTDQCGGSDYFSVYNITENKIRGREHSCVCENLQNLAHSIEECQICPVDLQFLCHNTSDKDDGKRKETNCSQIPLTWRQELRTCLKSGASFKISARSGESCNIDPVAVNHNDFQYSFVKLLFVWNTRPKSKYNYKCLGLRLEEYKEFKLLPINCTEKRKALCHKVSDEEMAATLSNQFITCPEHPSEKARFYCEDDHVVICDDCVIGRHSGHTKIKLIDYLNKKRHHLIQTATEAKHKNLPDIQKELEKALIGKTEFNASVDQQTERVKLRRTMIKQVVDELQDDLIKNFEATKIAANEEFDRFSQAAIKNKCNPRHYTDCGI